MLIQHIEIANFRKLLSVRVDLAEKTTVFVGANNSGKTSAMLALRRFLVGRQNQFSVHDLTLSHWGVIDLVGRAWIQANHDNTPPDVSVDSWTRVLPAIDLWISVSPGELHYVSKLLPSLDWTGGLLGVRLRLEPDNVEELRRDFMESILAAEEIRASEAKEKEAGEASEQQQLRLWPVGLIDFLSRRLNRYFKVRAYSLDPDKLADPENAVAKPQILSSSMPSIEDPLKGLIRVNEINAQRGFGETQPFDDEIEGGPSQSVGRLSEQLRGYYQRHLDPSENPEVNDLLALRAIEAAEASFNKRLAESFKPAFDQVSGLGYPGITDPRPIVATRLRPVDGLKHQSAVTFEIDVVNSSGELVPVMRLPEDNNGLGYQNLISMIFRLMSFRDAWMRVGKASKGPDASQFEPLHLVLVEEPEAHLHAQVQQVFIKKAYGVLRAHPDLEESKQLRTQMLVSTHSSHVTHETAYSCLRYFRRLPAGMNGISIPVSVVINLNEVFGKADETSRFVTRYLRTQHADLFFADALILVEGPAERMLLPNFIERDFPVAHQGYITLLEVGGSHAHKLKPLVEKLGLITLIITDLDAQTQKIIPAEDDKKARNVWEAAQPAMGASQESNNDTIKSWWPKKRSIDDLLAIDIDKVMPGDDLFAVRVAYQVPVEIVWPPSAATTQTALPYTFEDALAFENMTFFSTLEGPGLARKFREAIASSSSVADIGQAFFLALRKGEKAELALNILDAAAFDSMIVPSYISEGLSWLQRQIQKKQVDVLSTETVTKNG